MSKFLAAVLICFLPIGQLLHAEVQRVIVRWNPITCRELCIPRVERSLRAIPQVLNVYADAASGSASMEWDPMAPFSYEPFRFAAGAAGIYFKDIRLRVRGHIIHYETNFFLISEGDDTRFRLIGPTQIEPGRYVVETNIESHHLTRRMEELLLDAEDTNQILIISGPLFWPRAYPRTLIAEQIQVEKEKNNRSLPPPSI